VSCFLSRISQIAITKHDGVGVGYEDSQALVQVAEDVIDNCVRLARSMKWKSYGRSFASRVNAFLQMLSATISAISARNMG
jgi:hypothetical protein